MCSDKSYYSGGEQTRNVVLNKRLLKTVRDIIRINDELMTISPQYKEREQLFMVSAQCGSPVMVQYRTNAGRRRAGCVHSNPLDRDAKQNAFVDILALPQPLKDLKDGTICNVAGWGKTSKFSPKLSDKLRGVNVIVIHRAICNSPKHWNLHPAVTQNMLCAGDKKGKQDACTVDTGGPLVCSGMLRGITSVTACGSTKKPTIYTFLGKKLISWIQETLSAY
ncbi:granzyme A-like [Protopterus annectens]|uniref:granzyme A-like n=1 Tax=Protopterus annectens TaxID=7888 RepID=UPI001CFA9F72|nr:granzyme A-like [Protopterus annectens]